MGFEIAGQAVGLCDWLRVWLWLGMLLRSHLSPELHAISVERLEGKGVDVGKRIERADAVVDGRAEVGEGRVDVGRALFLDKATERGRVETGVEVLLEDTGTDSLFVKDGGFENGAPARKGSLGGEDGDRGDKGGVDGGDTHATETAPKGPVAEPGRGGEVFLGVWGDDGRCCYGRGSEGRGRGNGGQLGGRREVRKCAPLEETLFEGGDLLAESDIL